MNSEIFNLTASHRSAVTQAAQFHSKQKNGLPIRGQSSNFSLEQVQSPHIDSCVYLQSKIQLLAQGLKGHSLGIDFFIYFFSIMSQFSKIHKGPLDVFF